MLEPSKNGGSNCIVSPTRLLIEFYEQGYLTWGYQKHALTTQIHQQNCILLQKDYLNSLKKRGIGARTIQYYETVSRQFLTFLEQQKTIAIAEVRGEDIHLFILSISKRHQPTSMRTALSALRSFCRFVEGQNLALLQIMPTKARRPEKYGLADRGLCC